MADAKDTILAGMEVALCRNKAMDDWEDEAEQMERKELILDGGLVERHVS